MGDGYETIQSSQESVRMPASQPLSRKSYLNRSARPSLFRGQIERSRRNQEMANLKTMGELYAEERRIHEEINLLKARGVEMGDYRRIIDSLEKLQSHYKVIKSSRRIFCWMSFLIFLFSIIFCTGAFFGFQVIKFDWKNFPCELKLANPSNSTFIPFKKPNIPSNSTFNFKKQIIPSHFPNSTKIQPLNSTVSIRNLTSEIRNSSSGTINKINKRKQRIKAKDLKF